MSKFLGKSAPTCQSTPLPGHHLAVTTGKNPAMDLNTSGEDSMSFVTLDDAQGQHSEDSGVNLIISSISERERSSRVEVPAESSVETGCSSYPLDSKIEDIGKRAQDLIERINQSRAMDQDIMASFENKLLRKVSEACQQLKEQVFTSYDEHGHRMEASLQELSEVLERSSQLSSELHGASQTLSVINVDLLQTPGP